MTSTVQLEAIGQRRQHRAVEIVADVERERRELTPARHAHRGRRADEQGDNRVAGSAQQQHADVECPTEATRELLAGDQREPGAAVVDLERRRDARRREVEPCVARGGGKLARRGAQRVGALREHVTGWFFIGGLASRRRSAGMAIGMGVRAVHRRRWLGGVGRLRVDVGRAFVLEVVVARADGPWPVRRSATAVGRDVVGVCGAARHRLGVDVVAVGRWWCDERRDRCSDWGRDDGGRWRGSDRRCRWLRARRRHGARDRAGDEVGVFADRGGRLGLRHARLDSSGSALAGGRLRSAQTVVAVSVFLALALLRTHRHCLLRALLEVAAQPACTEHDREVLRVARHRGGIVTQPLEQTDARVELAVAVRVSEHKHHQLGGGVVIGERHRDRNHVVADAHGV